MSEDVHGVIDAADIADSTVGEFIGLLEAKPDGLYLRMDDGQLYKAGMCGRYQAPPATP